MTALLDANVLIALVVAEHVHHDAAAEWLSNSDAGFATCPITQGSLVRFLIRTGQSATATRDVNGVDSFVDLTTPLDGLAPYREEMELAAEITGREIRHFAHLPDMGVVDHDGYDRIIARIRGEIADGRVVYLHCWGGKGRTSTVVGCLLIDDGLDYESAIARIAELRAGTRKAIDPCPESPSQHRVLRERAARR